MRTLALDGRMGASGDMLLAALLDAGADRAVLAPVEDALDVRYVVDRTVKNGIDSTTVTVVLTGDADDGESPAGDDASESNASGADGAPGSDTNETDASDGSEPSGRVRGSLGGYGHDHGDDDHGHDHPHDHDRDHPHGHVHAEGHGPHRTYAEVVDIVESMGLPAPVEADALAVFERLGEAEAGVHGTDLDETHFHEVGADDAIADVVGVALLLDELDVDRVVTTPVAAGGGTVSMSHGTYPIPAPAVAEIAAGADWSLAGGPVEAELLTPTGAALLAHYAEGVDALPTLDVATVGYGAGGYDFPDHPNVLRALVGDGGGSLVRDEITVLETNVDDAPPEVLGGLQETLAAAGARDVSVLPATMKKSRPGHLVKVICKPEDAQRVARALAEETGTLGVREHGAGHRWVAHRDFRTVSLSVDGERHEVRVKVASDTNGQVYDVSAEYDDALAVARETSLPVREVMRRAEARVHEE